MFKSWHFNWHTNLCFCPMSWRFLHSEKIRPNRTWWPTIQIIVDCRQVGKIARTSVWQYRKTLWYLRFCSYDRWYDIISSNDHSVENQYMDIENSLALGELHTTGLLLSWAMRYLVYNMIRWRIYAKKKKIGPWLISIMPNIRLTRYITSESNK